MKINALTNIKCFRNWATYSLVLVATVMLPSLVFATEENSSPDTISSIATRDSGYHAVFLATTQLPNSDVCTLNDRGMIIESDSVSRTMMAFTLASMLNKSTIILRTDGCTSVNVGSATTAPKIIKVKVLAPD